MSTFRIFAVETAADTMIVKPSGNVSTLDGELVALELQSLLEELGAGKFSGVVIDFEHSAYFGTSMLAAMQALWRLMRRHGGKLAVCNLSDVGRQVLRLSRFDTVWPVCDSVAEAIEAVRPEK
jgi:anti-anti-sigma factor